MLNKIRNNWLIFYAIFILAISAGSFLSFLLAGRLSNLYSPLSKSAYFGIFNWEYIGIIGLIRINYCIEYRNIIMAIEHNIIIIAILSLILSLIQRKFLNERINIFSWCIYSMLGMFLSNFMVIGYQMRQIYIYGGIWGAETTADYLFETISIIINIFILGLCQWLIIKKIYKKAFIWIIVSALGYFVAELSILPTLELLEWIDKSRIKGLFYAILWIDISNFNYQSACAFGLSLGIFQGLAYIYFLKQHSKKMLY